MASIEKVDKEGKEILLLNVTQAVGPHHGAEDDVILVKALLKIVLEWWNRGKLFPEPSSGTLDKETKENIRRFQKQFNDHSQTLGSRERLTVDGRVSRACGKFSWDKNRPWTIAMLNEMVEIYAQSKDYRSAADMVIALFPHLTGILKIDPDTAEI